MVRLVIGLALFLGVHSISIFADAWRDRTVERIGKNAWQGLYSVAAAAGLVLIVVGYASARGEFVILYVPPLWLRYLAMALMIFVFPLLLAAYLPGRIKTATKHPMLVAVKTWAFAHLLVNGALPDVLLFGSVLAWAVVDRISYKGRKPRPLPAASASSWNDAIAVAAGLGIYAAFFLGGHAWLTGMPLVIR